MNDHNKQQPTPAPLRTPEQEKTLILSVTELYEKKILFNQVLGFTVQTLAENGVVVTFDMKTELIGHYQHGRLHGGVIASVLDATGGLAVLWSMVSRNPQETVEEAMNHFRPLGTIDLRIDYLRPGIGERFIAAAETIKLGRRIANTHMKLENEAGTLLSTGTGTYVVS